jgi:hypothetical protein
MLTLKLISVRFMFLLSLAVAGYLALSPSAAAEGSATAEPPDATANLSDEHRRLVEKYREAKADRTAEVISDLQNKVDGTSSHRYGGQMQKRFAERIRSIEAGEEDFEPMLDARKLQPGQVGTLFYIQMNGPPEKTAEVMQVIDDQNCLILGSSNYYTPEPIWLVGKTEGLVDGSNVNISDLVVRVVEPKRYSTALGAAKTVAAVEAINIDELERLYDAEAQAKDAEAQAELDAEKAPLAEALRQVSERLEELDDSRVARYAKAMSELRLYNSIKDTEGGAEGYARAKAVLDEVGEVSDDEVAEYRGTRRELRAERIRLVRELRELAQ